jgi:hypothetical protein
MDNSAAARRAAHDRHTYPIHTAPMTNNEASDINQAIQRRM